MADAQPTLSHSHRQTGANNPNWHGGRVLASNGYVLIRVGTAHHLADVRGYAYEHRLIAEEKIGRRLEPGELVHHKDENKQNNSPDNLEVVLGNTEHLAHHRGCDSNRQLPDESNELVECACGCGEQFLKYDEDKRPRRFITGHNTTRHREAAVLEVMQIGVAERLSEIARRIDKPKNAAFSALSSLIRRGNVVKVGTGLYQRIA